MSLKETKKKPYFRKSKWTGVPKDMTRLVKTELDEKDKEKYTQFNIPTKVLSEADPIDLWTHEFSEDAILAQAEREGLPYGQIERYSEKDENLYKHTTTAAHAAVSHDTDSSLMREGKVKDLTPAQFEDFFWDTGRLEKMYPRLKLVEQKWKAVVRTVPRAMRKEEKKQIVSKLKEIRDEAKGHVPSGHLNDMSILINKLEAGI